MVITPQQGHPLGSVLRECGISFPPMTRLLRRSGGTPESLRSWLSSSETRSLGESQTPLYCVLQTLTSCLSQKRFDIIIISSIDYIEKFGTISYNLAAVLGLTLVLEFLMFLTGMYTLRYIYLVSNVLRLLVPLHYHSSSHPPVEEDVNTTSIAILHII